LQSVFKKCDKELKAHTMTRRALMAHGRKLGRGLGSLIPISTNVPRDDAVSNSLISVPIEKISPNRQQPRQTFDEDKIKELADSIREQGLIQPLIVTKQNGGRYELIAGERRLRAARTLGLAEVPVVVKEVDDEDLLAIALIENVQREDLNPIEEARALKELINQFSYTQDKVAKKVGKSRSHVANSLRLLNLPQAIQDDLAAGRYSAGHARTLLALPNAQDRLKLRDVLLAKTPTVRDVEKMVQNRSGKNTGKKPTSDPKPLPPQIARLIKNVADLLDARVSLMSKNDGSGKLSINFSSIQELSYICRKIAR